MLFRFALIIKIVSGCVQPNSQPRQRSKISILPLYPYVETVRVNNGFKVRLYILENFRSYDEDSLILDRYVTDHIDPDYAKHFNYSIQFFEGNLPLAKGQQNGKVAGIDYKSPVLAYNWSQGVFRSINYSKKGLFWVYHKNKSGIFRSLDSAISPEPEKLNGEEASVEKK